MNDNHIERLEGAVNDLYKIGGIGGEYKNLTENESKFDYLVETISDYPQYPISVEALDKLEEIIFSKHDVPEEYEGLDNIEDRFNHLLVMIDTYLRQGF